MAALRVLTKSAPHACIALRRICGLLSGVKVLAWTIGTCERNAEKNRYTVTKNKWVLCFREMKISYSSAVAQGELDRGLTSYLQRKSVDCRLLQVVA
jgi:hypothetical protein